MGESNQKDLYDSGSSQNDGWQVLNKPSIEKRMTDIEWSIIHGIIARIKYRAHFDSRTREGCPFCSLPETCSRLKLFFSLVKNWVRDWGSGYDPQFYLQPQVYFQKETINFIFANAKIAIWNSWKNLMGGTDWTDPVSCFRGLVSARLRIKHTY